VKKLLIIAANKTMVSASLLNKLFIDLLEKDNEFGSDLCYNRNITRELVNSIKQRLEHLLYEV
jgi:hypothetical protein